MRVRVLREIPDDTLLRDQWDEVVERMEQPEVFYTYEWAVSVQRAYGSILRPILLLGYEDESLVGVAALAQKTNGEICFLGETTSDYCDFLSLPGLRGQWCDAVFGELRNFPHWPLSLGNLPTDSTTVSALSHAARKHGYRIFPRPAYRCARIVLGGDDDRVLLRDKTTGKTLQRKLRLLDQKKGAVFSSKVASEELNEVVKAFCRAHVTRFISGGRLSNMIQPERRAFLRELAQQLSHRGWLSMNRLLVGDHCVAWNYGFQFARSWFWYQPTFDMNYEQFSPGICLLNKVIAAACDNPQITVVDLGLGAEGYKEKFANQARQTLHVSVSSTFFAHAKTALRHRASEMIKTRPAAEHRVRSALDRLTYLQCYLHQKGLRPAVHNLLGHVHDRLIGREEVHFFQYGNGIGAQADGFLIRKLNLDLLGQAALDYYEDRGTLAYLLRAAQRLRMGVNPGFALLDSNGTPVHFCWVSEFENFKMQELERRLTAPSANAVLIFDCWSPVSVRGRNHFATAIAVVAGELCSSGKMPWIFAAARNYASVNGILKAGFNYRFTMHRRRLFGLTQAVKTIHRPVTPVSSVSAGLRDYVHSEN